MLFKPARALKASISALVARLISNTGRSHRKFTGLKLNGGLASARGLSFCFFRRLVVLVSCFHRRACRLGSQTTNRFFNYSRDIPGLLALRLGIEPRLPVGWYHPVRRYVIGDRTF